MLTAGTAAIAADHRGHVKQFPDVQAYDDYYDIIVGIGEVGVESFAARVQELLVEYIRDKYGEVLPTGVAIFGRAIAAGCVSRMLGTPDATTTWASKSPGKISRRYAAIYPASQHSSAHCASSSATSLGRSICTA